MTMDQPGTGSAQARAEAPFEIALRGYHRRQVEEYIAWMQDQQAAVQAEAEDLRRALAQVQEAAADREGSGSRPQHEEVSERLSQILRLAEEEAEQERDRATLIADETVEAAHLQARAVLEAAQGQAEATLAASAEQADDELAAARAEANHLVQTAHAQATADLEDARLRAQAVLAHADRRTAEITTLQEDRLASLLTVHADAVRRLQQIRSVLGEVLQEEADMGSPAGDIAAAPLPVAGPPVAAEDVDLPVAASGSEPAAAAQRPDPFRRPQAAPPSWQDEPSADDTDDTMDREVTVAMSAVEPTTAFALPVTAEWATEDLGDPDDHASDGVEPGSPAGEGVDVPGKTDSSETDQETGDYEAPDHTAERMTLS